MAQSCAYPSQIFDWFLFFHNTITQISDWFLFLRRSLAPISRRSLIGSDWFLFFRREFITKLYSVFYVYFHKQDEDEFDLDERLKLYSFISKICNQLKLMQVLLNSKLASFNSQISDRFCSTIKLAGLFLSLVHVHIINDVFGFDLYLRCKRQHLESAFHVGIKFSPHSANPLSPHQSCTLSEMKNHIFHL
jgi:hypothetical protein